MKHSLLALLALPVATAALALGAAPAVAGSADQPIADEGIIVAADMPATWTASPPDDSDTKQNLKLAAKIPACKSYVKFAKASEATTKAASDEYASGDHQLSNKSYVHENDATAETLIDALGGSKVPSCLSQVFEKAFDKQIKANPNTRKVVEGIDVVLEPVDAGDIADDTVAYEGSLTINLTDGSSQTLNIGLLGVRVGRVITTYSVTAPPGSTEIDAVLANALTATLTRTANAL